MTAHTDRRDADETTFQAMRDRIENTPACDIEADVVGDVLHKWMGGDRDYYDAPALAVVAALKPAPGTDPSGQAVQRVLALADELERDDISYSHAAHRIRAAVAGPQRDHDEEGER